MLADFIGLPESLWLAAIAACVAAAGYVAKIAYEKINAWLERRAADRGRLIELAILLRTSYALFRTQREQAERLYSALRQRLGDPEREFPDTALRRHYPALTPEEREQHIVIRSATIHGMKAMNDALLEWVSKDLVYRTTRDKSGLRHELADALQKMEIHLRMWRAKYEAWIPNHPENALVYLGDELNHGPAFPAKINHVVEALLK